MQKFIVTLQPDDGKIAGALALVDKRGKLKPVAYESLESSSFRKAYVYNSVHAVKSVKEVVGRLSELSPRRISGVWCGISSASIGVIASRGSMLLSKYGRTIIPRDVKKCVKIASSTRLPLDTKDLHKVISGFAIDGCDAVADPVGMEAVKLEAGVKIVTVKSSVMENLKKCVEEAGFLLDGFVYLPMADYYGFVPERLKKRKIALIDVSFGNTQIAQFEHGKLSYAKGFKFTLGSLFNSMGRIMPENTDMCLEKISGMLENSDIEKLVITGELTVSDEFMDRLEARFRLPIEALSLTLSNSDDVSSGNLTSRKLYGMLKYLERDVFFCHEKKGPFYGLRTNITKFIESYF